MTDPTRTCNPGTATGTCADDQKQEIKELKQQIPVEYHDYIKLFKEWEPEHALPEHKPWDHEIPLQNGGISKKHPIYQHTEEELAELQKYINMNLMKEYIYKSKSSAAYPIYFVSKKDRSIQLCINYW